MSDTYFAINNKVMGEVIDGEAVIINLTTNQYFSATGTGAFIWSAIEAALPVAEIRSRLAEAYGVDPAAAEAAVSAFASALEAHGLVRTSDAQGPATNEADALVAIGVFAEPALTVYDDMQDLLMLDPIHESEEEAGWPVAQPTIGLKAATTRK